MYMSSIFSLMHISLNNIDIFCLHIFEYVLLIRIILTENATILENKITNKTLHIRMKQPKLNFEPSA